MVTAAHRDNGRNQMKCIGKGKPKYKNKIRLHEKNTHLPLSPLIFPCHSPPHSPPPPFPLSCNGGGERPFPLPPLHWQQQRLTLSPPWQRWGGELTTTTAAAMTTMPTPARDKQSAPTTAAIAVATLLGIRSKCPRQWRRRPLSVNNHHRVYRCCPSQRPPDMHPTSILPSPVVTFCFCKTAAYTVKLAATTMLSLLSYLLPCGRPRATTVYKLNKKCNTID
jgi:hypothetical protein